MDLPTAIRPSARRAADPVPGATDAAHLLAGLRMWAQAQFRSDQLVREILEAGDATALGLTVLRGALLAGDALAAHVLDGAANTFAFAMRGALPRDQTRLFL